MKEVIYKTPKIRQNEVEIKDDKLGVLNNFQNTLKNTSFDLSLFYRNLETLKISPQKFTKTYRFETGAEYHMLFNEISYNPECYQNAIYHELLHMSSNLVGNHVIFNGFSQSNPKSGEIFGFGIKEAYTCILDERYFGSYDKKNYYQGVYQISRDIVLILEELIGQDKMELLYSQADLVGLIKELSKYYGKSAAIDFINYVDKISYYNEISDYINPIISVIAFRFCMTYLGRCLIKKYTLEYKNDKDQGKYKRLLFEVRKLMDKRIIYPIPFKIIKSRKYTDKKFEHDMDIIKNKVMKKYA